jgi:hypothetical protein
MMQSVLGQLHVVSVSLRQKLELQGILISGEA